VRAATPDEIDERLGLVSTLEKRDGAWHAQLLAVPADHVGAADVARQRGRPDWEVALLYGGMKATSPPLQPPVSSGS
jgi:hypothetical protein